MNAKHCDGVTLSIEGSTVQRLHEAGCLTTDFHSHLSDEKTQTAAVVYNNMKELCKVLMEQGLLKKGGRLLGVTDGCAKQCECATAVYYLSIGPSDGLAEGCPLDQMDACCVAPFVPRRELHRLFPLGPSDVRAEGCRWSLR